jgi:predicted ATPase/class 3 adenylate cyclase
LKPDSELSGEQGSAWERSERRLLTALCYDIVGSTDLLRRTDVEEFQDLISAFQQKAKQAITTRGGSILVEAGDGGTALFPLGIDSKDAASLAIYAGLDIVEACRQVSRERSQADMRVRVGIATSVALIRGSQSMPTADQVTALALALATRLQSMAEPDTVLVSQQTRNLARRSHAFRSHGVHHLKGFDEAEPVWCAIERRRDVDRFLAFGRLNVPFVGRAAELQRIQGCWSDVTSGSGRILLIEGPAGIGKSRLLRELRHQTKSQRRKLLLFQCLPGSATSTLHPLLQNVRGTDGARPSRRAIADLFERYRVTDPTVVDVFAFLLGAEESNESIPKDIAPDLVKEKVDGSIRLGIDQLCAAGPVVLMVEDAHWIDATSKRLVIEIARDIDRYPLLLVVTMRAPIPEDWHQLPCIEHIALDRLSPAETRIAIEEMWPKDKRATLPQLLELADRVTGGVPLFIEELCQWVREDSGSTQDQLAKAISPKGPSILQNILDARLEPLGQARDVAQAASVAGPRFGPALLREMLPRLSDQAVAEALERLSDAGIVAPLKSPAAELYAFRHALIQETVYNGLLRKLRQEFHRRVFLSAYDSRGLTPWMSTAELAGHAEQAGMVDNAITWYVTAGKESSARSAMAEARTLLERALALCGKISERDRQEQSKLACLSALGPVLTSMEGPGSPDAQKLYEDGIEIARRRPAAERASLFPIYWGWWFTGNDIDNKRAQAILHELQDVDDPEIQLQLRHCVWAIDFYLGRHQSCIAAVNAGVSLYGAGHGKENVTLFGGHDAKVCGLSHRGLSEWLTGRPASALRSVAEAQDWALSTGHVGSIAHAYHNHAMLHYYRRDFRALCAVIADFHELAAKHSFRSLAATFRIFEGWCEGADGKIDSGRLMIEQGLAIHEELQTPEDYPVYCCMLAELMMQSGKAAAALELLARAEAKAEEGGHRYWLAELHHRRARLLFQLGRDAAAIVAALEKSLETATQQNAVPLLLTAFDTLCSFGMGADVVARYRASVEAARAQVEAEIPLVVQPERAPASQAWFG